MMEFAHKSPYLDLMGHDAIADEATGRVLNNLHVKAGKGYSFLQCVCGGSHWVCIVPQVAPGGKNGLPPVVAFICRDCMRLLDGDQA